MDPILLVDDDAELLEAVRQSLVKHQLEVVVAKNGNQAYAILEERTRQLGQPKIQVVISDWMMPDGDGIELLNKIRSGPYYKLPFLLISGAVSREQIIAIASKGADAVLLKPFQEETLLQQMAVAISRRDTTT